MPTQVLRVMALPALALVLAAVILGAVAWSTYRDLHRRGRLLEAHQAVNRLVLAKSCALAGAMVAGGYFGYALSFWRAVDAPLEQLGVGDEPWPGYDELTASDVISAVNEGDDDVAKSYGLGGNHFITRLQ